LLHGIKGVVVVVVVVVVIVVVVDADVVVGVVCGSISDFSGTKKDKDYFILF
jgi:hypothetical protein